MNRELYKLELEIRKVKRELGDILKCENNIDGDNLMIEISERLDRVILRYIEVRRYRKTYVRD